jgi:hypothetical protein
MQNVKRQKNHQPKMTKDKGKNDVWSDESKKDPIITACYEKDKTELKKEWIFVNGQQNLQRQYLGRAVLILMLQIFSDHLKNSA